ncbi:esterase-like activity of phytase family protein [Sphingomonas sp. PB4P5]|uniref:esterase-like activity of phytase family protein n=1 Tax=Parasphingomonas puruogangriensis TaxID=3096155 RepID=UPI002FCB6B37
MRAWLSILSLLIIAPDWDGPQRLGLLDPDAQITATRVGIDPAQPRHVRLGRLTYLGGVELRSPDPVFGGFSAMQLTGDRFTLLSDGGGIVRFRLDAQGRISDQQIAELPAGPATGWEKRDRDSESLIVDAATGDVLIGFERVNEIWRYDALLTRAIRHAAPKTMHDWDENGGPEAMVRLADGRTIVLAESSGPKKKPGRYALSFAGDPTRSGQRAVRFLYMPPAGFDPSDAAALPDGRILVLNRRFATPFDFAAKLTIVDPRTIRAGAMVRGQEVATIDTPLTRDNFEGLVVTKEGQATVIWLISDDNQFFLERTLLMKFRLEPAPHAKQ